MQYTIPDLCVEGVAQGNTPGFARLAGAAYMISVSVHVGSTTLTLDADLFKAARMSKTLKENGVVSKETLPIYEVFLADGESHPIAGRKRSKNQDKFSLQMAGLSLSNALDAIQRAHMICSGNHRWWFFPPSKYDEVMGELEALKVGVYSPTGKLLKAGRKQLLEQLREYAPAARRLLESRLVNILGKAERLEQLPKYLGRFPTLDELEENFRIEIEGPLRIPSVAEIANETPEFKEFLIQIREQMQRDFPEWLNRASATISGFLKTWQGITPPAITPKQAYSLNEYYARLETDAELHDAMGFSDIHPARHLLGECLQFTQEAIPDVDTLTEKLKAIKQRLSHYEWVAEPTLKGTRELARWCGIVTLEDRIKQFRDDVEACREIVDLTERRQAFEVLQRKARTFGGMLYTTATYLLQDVGLPSEQLMIDMGVIPDTEIATTPPDEQPSDDSLTQLAQQVIEAQTELIPTSTLNEPSPLIVSDAAPSLFPIDESLLDELDPIHEDDRNLNSNSFDAVEIAGF